MIEHLELWPALNDVAEPVSVDYERAVWGKAHGASSDYRWLAATEGFNRSKNLDQQFSLSGIDKNSELLFWRCLEENNQRRYFAGHVYPSQARDAAGRGDILERQLLECRLEDNEFIPYIALYLLKTVNDWRDDIWWSRRDEIDWADENNLLLLEDAKTLAMQKLDLFGKALEQGIDELNQLNINEEIINFYALLLSDEKISILYSRTALSPNALAALLLPIEPQIINSLSILANVPSISSSEIENLRLHWDVLVLLSRPNAGLSSRARKQYVQAERMAMALLENNPALLNKNPNNKMNSNTSSANETQLALWGESSSGKTVFLAQLHLHTDGKNSDWDIFPTDTETPEFINKMRSFLANNSFPPPTDKDEIKLITYEFIHRQSNRKASLTVEDMAGGLHKELHEKSMQRMTTAAGLALLVTKESQNTVVNLLETMLIHRRLQNREDRKDPRPMAICIPKADSLINSMDDYCYACEQPDAFIRSNPDWADLVKRLDKHCANYQFFPLSAIGVDPNYGHIEPSTFYDENFNPRVKNKMQPFNLLEPFVWLAQQLEMISHD